MNCFILYYYKNSGKMVHRVPLECYICREEKERGGDVQQVVYVRLVQHLKVSHGMSAVQAIDKAREERVKLSTRKKDVRSKSGRKCGMYCVNKTRHLTTAHKMVKGSQEYQRELKSSFLTISKARFRITEPRGEQHSDSEVSSELNDGSSSSSSGDEGLNPVVPPTRPEKRMMTLEDVSFVKWQRVIPSNCKPFIAVQRWFDFRVQRAGGNKNVEQQKNDMAYVNRFLAFCKYDDFNFRQVTTVMVSKHDIQLVKNFEAGTVKRVHQAVMDFWKWARQERYIKGVQYDSVLQYLTGCLAACRKDANIRTTERRVEEEHSLPSPSTYDEFKSSVYVKGIREKFMRMPFMHLKDMTGILIVLTSYCNGPRVSVYENIRFADIERATTDDGDLYTISVGKHKTSGMGRGKKAAFLTVEKDIYSELKLYARTVRNVFKLIDASAQLFRGNTGQPADIKRLAKSAWRKAGMPGEFSLTQMRKLTTVTGRKTNPAMAGEIARQLCHRESTADQYYAVHDDRQSAVRVYRHLKQSFSQRSATQTYAEACESGDVDDRLSLEEAPSEDARELNELIKSLPQRSATQTLAEASESGEIEGSILQPEAPAENPSDVGHARELNGVPQSSATQTLAEASESGKSFGSIPQQEALSMPTADDNQSLISDSRASSSIVAPSVKSGKGSLFPGMPYVCLTPLSADYDKKPRVRYSARVRGEIRDAFAEIILEYAFLPYKTVPVKVIRGIRGDRWPDLTDAKLRDLVRSLVKEHRRDSEALE
ncbi:hypothetical protein ACF0H5_019041 [Mactra antiquata]